MDDVLTTLSRRTAALVAERAPHVVRVEGRRRGPASGVVWSADGLVVTAHHVLERDEEVELGLPSGETVTAEVVGRDPTTDLALLRAKATGLAAPDWVDPGSASPGELVLALSRPGKNVRASLGIVARTAGEWRTGAGGKIDRYLETSVELAPGMSGSLVVGAGGAALGVASAGLVRGTVMVVPPLTLRRVVGSLAAHGGVRRGYLGVATFPVRLGALAARCGQPHALLVSAVEPASPAERGGLLVGDALLALGGAPVAEPGDLLPLLEEDRIGQPVAARIVRGGEVRELTVTMGARGERAGRRP
jgi:S1-C subfamily serine protease